MRPYCGFSSAEEELKSCVTSDFVVINDVFHVLNDLVIAVVAFVISAPVARITITATIVTEVVYLPCNTEIFLRCINSNYYIINSII